MPVIDAVIVFPQQAWQDLNFLLTVPNFQMLNVLSYIHMFTDKSAVHGINVVINIYGTAASDLDIIQTLAVFQRSGR